MADDLDILEGEWLVKVQGWVWAYTFGPKGKLTWKDTRSPEQGTGSWSATPKAVNISWIGGEAKESWLRPLTASNNKTWYSSSYFTGKYQIDKKGAATTSSGTSSPAITLDKPPHVKQTALYCWAAGASSWMRVRGRGNQTVEQLIEKYGGYLNTDGSMPENTSNDPGALKGGIRTVFDSIGLRIQLIPVKELTYEYFVARLKQYGHFLLMYQYGGSMGHTVVVYGAGAPNGEYFTVMDPISGYPERKFNGIEGNSAYVGFAK